MGHDSNYFEQSSFLAKMMHAPFPNQRVGRPAHVGDQTPHPPLLRAAVAVEISNGAEDDEDRYSPFPDY